MRLNQRNMGGVQSLGQVDINAPGRKWQAKTQAKNAMASAFDAGANQLGVIFKAQEEAVDELQLQQRLLEDGVSFTRKLTYLENTPVIDLANATDVPASIKEYASQWAIANPDASGNIPTTVKTHEIIDGFMQDTYRRSTEESVDALSESGLASDYVKAIDATVIAGSAQTLKIKLKQRQEDLKAQADEQFQAAVMANDEMSAAIIAKNNVEIGAWTPKVANENLTKLGPQLDYNTINEAIVVAETQNDLDAAMNMLDFSRVLPADRPKLLNQFRSQQKYFDTQSTQVKAKNYESGMQLLTSGRLTKEWVVGKLARHEISGGQANTLRTALNQVAPRAADPGVLDDFQRRIAGIKYGDGAENTTITERAETVRRELQRQITGVNPDGSVFQPTLLGADVLKMNEEIDKLVNASLGKGGQQYTIAAKQIKTLTGFSDNFAKVVNGPYPAGIANAEFTSALQNYMDYAGPNADPMEFVAKNASKYTAEIYSKKQIERLAIQYPRYKQDLLADDMPYRAGASAFRDYSAGILSWDDYETIRRGLAFLGVTPVKAEVVGQSKEDSGLRRSGEQ